MKDAIPATVQPLQITQMEFCEFSEFDKWLMQTNKELEEGEKLDEVAFYAQEMVYNNQSF
jgi:hypothetical protein